MAKQTKQTKAKSPKQKKQTKTKSQKKNLTSYKNKAGYGGSW